MVEKRKNAYVIHRADDDLISLLEGIRTIILKESGVRPSRSQIVELAIRELAKKKKVR